MADPQFSVEHRVQFQQLLAVGEVYALNLHPEYLAFGPWGLGSDLRGDDAAERLRSRFLAAVRKAAISAGAPARVTLLDWWICRLVRGKKQFRLEGVIQRSVELCEEFESKSAELGLAIQASDIVAGLRRDFYPIDFIAPHRLYDHPHDPLSQAEDEFDYWRKHVWRGFWELVKRREAVLNGGEQPVYDLRRRQPGEARIAFRARVLHRVSNEYHTLKFTFRCLSYDLGVLLANYVIDRGLRGDAAIRAFASESVELIDTMQRVWRESSTRLGLSWRKQEKEDIDFKTPFRDVAADLRRLASRSELADEGSGATVPSVAARPTDFWRDMESRFLALRAEYGDGLHAKWIPKPLEGYQHHWYLSGGGDPEQGSFRVLAERAAVELRHSAADDGYLYWLELLRSESPHVRDGGSATYYDSQGQLATDQSRVVEALHKTSAEFCLQLESKDVFAARDQANKGSGRDSVQTPVQSRSAFSVERARPRAESELAASHGVENSPIRTSPKEFIDAHKRRRKCSYEKLASHIGIGKDTLYAITLESRWVSDENYRLVSEVCGCKPEDLHPRDLPRPQRRRS
jgi:hypothetical protein